MPSFDDEVVRLAVKTYVLSMPIFGNAEAFEALISANAGQLRSDGSVILYLHAAGTALALGAGAFQGPSAEEIFIGRMPPGLGNLPGRVDSELRSRGVVIGEEFLWLSKVLPKAVAGDRTALLESVTPNRQQLMQWVQLIKQLNPELLRGLTDEMQLAQPSYEQSVYNLVSQLNV